MKTEKTKKYRIVAPVRFTAIVTTLVLISVFVISGLFGYSDVSAAPDPEYVSVRVQSGDTLWTLANTYGPEDQDVRETIYQIRTANNMSSAEIYAGQYIIIPTN